MSAVTIEGSVTPSSFLPRGERRTVERTDFIDKLIKRGFVTVVKPTEPVLEAAQDDVPDAPAPTVTVEPSRGASREEWAAWLSRPDVAIPFEESDGRNVLIEKWDASVDAAAGSDG